MQSEIERVAQALCDEMAKAAFSLEFVPQINYDAQLELEDAATLHVDIVPVKAEPAEQDRGSIAWTHSIDIGIRMRFGTEHQDSETGRIQTQHVNSLMCLEQEIITWLFAQSRQAAALNQSAIVMTGDPAVRVAWVPKHMHEWNQFTGIIRVAYFTETDIPDTIQLKQDPEDPEVPEDPDPPPEGDG